MRAAEPGALQAGLHQRGVLHARVAEGGVGKVGLVQHRALEGGAGEVGAVQVGAGEVGLGEVGAREVRAEEVGAGEARAPQVRAGEAHVGEFHAGEVGARALRTFALKPARVVRARLRDGVEVGLSRPPPCPQRGSPWRTLPCPAQPRPGAAQGPFADGGYPIAIEGVLINGGGGGVDRRFPNARAWRLPYAVSTCQRAIPARSIIPLKGNKASPANLLRFLAGIRLRLTSLRHLIQFESRVAHARAWRPLIQCAAQLRCATRTRE